jgi:hypothetical protein
VSESGRSAVFVSSETESSSVDIALVFVDLHLLVPRARPMCGARCVSLKLLRGEERGRLTCVRPGRALGVTDNRRLQEEQYFTSSKYYLTCEDGMKQLCGLAWSTTRVSECAHGRDIIPTIERAIKCTGLCHVVI